MVIIKYVKPAEFPKDIEEYLSRLDTSQFTKHDFDMLEIKKRDKFICHFCGCQKLTATVHHKRPIRNGGQDSLNNCLTICKECHDKLEYLITQSYPISMREFVPIILNKLSKTIYIWSTWPTKPLS